MDIAVLVGTYHMARNPHHVRDTGTRLDGARGLVAVQPLWAPRTCSLGAASANITDTIVSHDCTLNHIYCRKHQN
jgi:hypothetical protein